MEPEAKVGGNDPSDLQARTWRPRPFLSLIFGAVLLLGPIALAWIVVRIVGSNFYQPPGTRGLLIWIAQAVVVSSTVTILIHRLAERLSPLTVLLKLTLVFPDHAPSRFATALRIGNMNRVVRDAAPLSGSLNEAAISAVEMVVALTHHDRRTRGHTERVRAYGEMIAEEMGIEGEELNRIRWGLLLHDIGKLAVPDDILNKSSELTDDEWKILRDHPAAGAEMVEPLRAWLGDHVDAAGQHHEKWDGSGYPKGLAGMEISLVGRVCAIADAYDVITSRRSYKAPMSAAHARAELVEGAGTHFDPVVVRTFLRLGLRRKPALGFLGWVLEIPAIGSVIAASVTTPSVAAAASAVTLSLAAIVAPSPAPDAVAFSAPSEDTTVEVAPITTTTSTTTTTRAPSVTTTTRDPRFVTTTTISTDSFPAAALVASASTTTVPSPTTTTVPATSTTTTSTTTTSTTTSTTTVPPSPAPILTTTSAVPTTTSTSVPVLAPTTTATAPIMASTTTTIPSPPQSVEGDGFVFVEQQDVPPSLAEEAFFTPVGIVFLEQDAYALSTPIEVSLAGADLDLSAESAAVVIAEGTTVCSYLYHFAPSEDSTTRAVIEFPGEVLGHTTNADSLAGSDDFELSGIDYDWNRSAGVRIDDYISVNGNVVTFDLTVRNIDRDQIRVFTDCG